MAAAFGRLCVETTTSQYVLEQIEAAAFGRLCVETIELVQARMMVEQPPSGGCVLKPTKGEYYGC